jgi:hypothetical protein
MKMPYNNHVQPDRKKRRSLLALLFASGDVKRWNDNDIYATL